MNALIAEKTGKKLWFGPDVATANRATIAGMIGNNSAGAHSVLYGRTVENLVGLDVLLPDGKPLHLREGAALDSDRLGELTREICGVITPLADEIRRRFPRTKRRVAGYNLDLILDQIEQSRPGEFDRVNLSHLVCGSEGTLCVTTGATLKLVDKPACRGIVACGFRSVDEAIAVVPALLETEPAAIELLDDFVIGLARHNLVCRKYLEHMPQPTNGKLEAVLYVEYFGDSPAELPEKLDRPRTILGNDSPFSVHDNEQSIENVWNLRKAAEPLVHAIPGSRKPVGFVEDTAVPPEDLAGYIKEFRAIVEDEGTQAAFYAHASVGCLHVRPFLDLRNEHDLDRMHNIAIRVADLVRQYGGAMSAEHGDGRARGALLEMTYGPEITRAFRQIKGLFDPDQRMNPGNIVDPEPITEHLRVRPDREAIRLPQVDSLFDYSQDSHSGGAGDNAFEEAIELCNGAGVCRKKTGGTMCPSYRATLDERHSTRGRGNALRLALTGQLHDRPGRALWNDPETLATLDLCLSCKACKSECPTNVDLARYKSEYLAQSHKAAGRVPLAAKAFGRIDLLNRLASIAPELVNQLLDDEVLRRIAKRILKIAPERSLPTFAKPLHKQLSERCNLSGTDEFVHPSSSAPAVVLYGDCFTTYNEPHIGMAAVDVLQSFGYRVITPKTACCGRSMISTGLLDDAKRSAGKAAGQLIESLEQNEAVAVVVCEPSCLAAIKDEWRSLRLDVPSAELNRLAEISYMPEEFLELSWESHPARPVVTTDDLDGGETVLHGHCHQKALWGTDVTASLFRRLGLGDFRVLDSGCCGMAGSFGYVDRHYDLSMKVAELALFPAIRELDEDRDMVLAPGTSCRSQIMDGLNRRAFHPIEMVARLLGCGERSNTRTPPQANPGMDCKD
jgi:FAD/FMN-containing dehydrogenase/Fe-S oxidoreductase